MNKFIIIIFLVWLASPISALLIFDRNKSIGFNRVKDFDKVSEKLLTTNGVKYLSDGLFERSKATSLSIKLKNGVLFYLFSHVDTDKLISGDDGWLYYKPQFMLSDCDAEHYKRQLQVAGNSAALFAQIADTVDIKVVYSVSPNKARVHPEGISKSVLAYANCHTENEPLFDTYLKNRIPSLVLHHEAMQRDDIPSDNYYFFKNNTHWNILGYSKAMLQLKEKLETGFLEQNNSILDISDSLYELRNQATTKNMLLLEVLEKGPVLKPDIFSPEVDSNLWPIEFEGNALVVHDSFYAFYKNTDLVFGDKAKLINNNIKSQRALIIGEIEKKPNLVVFNSVERFAINRFATEWGARGAYFKNILKMNLDKAKKECVYDENQASVNLIPFNKQGIYNNETVSGLKDNPRFALNIPKTMNTTCLNLTLHSPRPTTIDILFTPLSGQVDVVSYELGRFLSIPVQRGSNSIDLILPKGLESNQIHIRPTIQTTETLKEFKILFGRLP